MIHKSIDDFFATKNILENNIRCFHEGNRDLYRVVAVECRKLVCDGKNSLLLRIFPNIKFHRLKGYIPERLKKNLVFQIPSTVHFDGKGGFKVVELFNKNSDLISPDDWLNQELFNKDITIRELIRSVSDKESAHSDKSYNPTLSLSKSVKFIDEDIHKSHIVAIGEYLLQIINLLINNNPELKKIYLERNRKYGE